MPSATRNRHDCARIGRVAFEAAATLSIMEILNASLKHPVFLF